MDAFYAKQILQSLADGVNPATGEVLSREDSCNEPEVIRALHWVLQELEKAEKPAKATPRSGRENAGTPWTEEDEKMLCIMFDRGDAKKDMCNYFKRSERGIAARLVKLGIITSRDEFEYGRK